LDSDYKAGLDPSMVGTTAKKQKAPLSETVNDEIDRFNPLRFLALLVKDYAEEKKFAKDRQASKDPSVAVDKTE